MQSAVLFVNCKYEKTNTMARQTGVVTFTGKLGNVIGYRLPGSEEHFLRSMPEHVERSYATKRSAMDFGKASRGGRLIRQAMDQELELPHDCTRTNRINQVLLSIVHADTGQLTGMRSIRTRYLSALTGFKLNNETGLEQLLTFSPVVEKEADGNIRVTCKPTAKKTKNTTHIEIKAIVFGVDFAKGKNTPVASESILVDVKNQPDKVELIVPYDGKETAFVVLQVIPFQMVNGEASLLQDRNFLAADIIAVLKPEKDLSVTVICNTVEEDLFSTNKTPHAAKGHSPPS